MFTRVVKDVSVATFKTVNQRSHMLNASTINMEQFKSNSQNVSQTENHKAETVSSSTASHMGETGHFDSWSQAYSSSSRDATSIFEDNGDLKVSFKLFLCQF